MGWLEQAQQQQSLAGLFSGSLGALGGVSQQQMNPYQVFAGATPMDGNFLNRPDLVTVSFFDRLRNEIDEWLKL